MSQRAKLQEGREHPFYLFSLTGCVAPSGAEWKHEDK